MHGRLLIFITGLTPVQDQFCSIALVQKHVRMRRRHGEPRENMKARRSAGDPETHMIVAEPLYKTARNECHEPVHSERLFSGRDVLSIATCHGIRAPECARPVSVHDAASVGSCRTATSELAPKNPSKLTNSSASPTAVRMADGCRGSDSRAGTAVAACARAARVFQFVETPNPASLTAP